MDIKTFTSVVPRLPAGQAILVRGPHGIGKSQLFRQISENVVLSDGSVGVPLIDRRLAQMTEGDIIGLPELVDGVTRFAPVEWLLRACREPVALMLDEINRATPEVMQCAFQLVLDRELNGHVLHPETRIYCAVNASSDYQVNEMDPALLDRFWVVDLDVNEKDWIDWAKSSDIDPIIVEFIRDNPCHLRHKGTVEPGKVYPSPRSYEKLDVALKSASWNPIDLAGRDIPDGFYAVSLGFLGTEAAITFRDFVKNYELQISAEDILDRWSKNSEMVLKMGVDRHNGLIEKLVDHSRDNEWSVTQTKNACDFIRELSDELLVSFFNSIMDTNNVPNIRSVHKFIGMAVVEAVTAAQKA